MRVYIVVFSLADGMEEVVTVFRTNEAAQQWIDTRLMRYRSRYSIIMKELED